ncbi:MAG TPA: hypothetical protein VFC19_29265 [Candidatus Limnocylindrales bacterium]|nr:hypothetical protein [Candidatus Limnocylindrales bacterium]
MIADTLSQPEQTLWDAYPLRNTVDLDGAADNSVRAEVIRALLLGARTAEPGQLPGLTLRRARIVDFWTSPLPISHVRYNWNNATSSSQ